MAENAPDADADADADAELLGISTPFLSNALFGRFDEHVKTVDASRKRRREALAFKSALEADGGAADGAGDGVDDLDSLGVRLPEDTFQGDTNMRTLETLLKRVDARGFERCARPTHGAVSTIRSVRLRVHENRSSQQLEFHAAFTKAAARIIYRDTWATDAPQIMQKHGWTKVNSEVLISTPRRFGKTFSIVRARRLAHTHTPPTHAHIRARVRASGHFLCLPRALLWPRDCRLQSAANRSNRPPAHSRTRRRAASRSGTSRVAKIARAHRRAPRAVEKSPRSV
jgi:hypothetical protein